MAAVDGNAINDPRATRMGAIAWLSQNVIIGNVFGTAGVMLIPLQARLHVSRGAVSAGIPIVMVASALLASVAGMLAARYSLRRLMFASGLLMTLAWLVLAYAPSYWAFIVADGILLGPAMALGGSVLPPTIVTRWFQRNRGLAIGIVHLPIVITIMPVVASLLIGRFGLTALFLSLALLSATTLLPAAAALVEYPAGHVSAGQRGQSAAGPIPPRTSSQVFTTPQLLRDRRLWLLALAIGVTNASSVTLGTHLPAMGVTWGYGTTSAAALASVMSLLGMAGSVIFGFISDRIGGARAIALIAVDEAILWALLVLDLPYAMRAVVIGLIGMHGAGTIPAISKALASVFGEASFSRAFGLAFSLGLPLMVAGVFGFGVIFQERGSYVAGVLGMVVAFLIAIAAATQALRCLRATAA